MAARILLPHLYELTKICPSAAFYCPIFGQGGAIGAIVWHNLHTKCIHVLQSEVGQVSDEILARLADLKAGQDALRADVSELKNDASELKSDVSGMKNDVAGMKSDVTGLKKDVAGLKSDVIGLKNDVAGLKSDVARIQQTVTQTRRNNSDNFETVLDALESLGAQRRKAS